MPSVFCRRAQAAPSGPTELQNKPILKQKIETTPQQPPALAAPKPLPPGLPDLQVTRVFLSKPYQKTPLTTSPLLGDKIDFCCHYANNGKDIPGSSWTLLWKLAFHLDGNLAATYDAGPMTSGESNTICTPYTVNKEGFHEVDCVLDTQNKISETSESNNRKTTTYSVAVTDSPMPSGLGVNLRVTDLAIGNDGLVAATVQNFGPSDMAFDAKIRLYRDNVQFKECLWPKNLNKTVCAKNIFDPVAPGTPPIVCNWGKQDYKIHAQIIAELGQPQVDKSGRYKQGMLYARQDLYAAYFYEDAISKNVGIVVGNKGVCYATPWSYKFYIDGNLKETGPLMGGLLKKNEYARFLLKSQALLTDSVKRNSQFKFEVVPQYPDYEQNTGNNVYQVKGLSTASGVDLAVTAIKFLGETNLGFNYTPDDSNYFRIVPYFKNISSTKMSQGMIKMETFVDGVSKGEEECYCGLAAGEEIPASDCSPHAFGAFPILATGSHTVRFVITVLDANIYNNHLVKTMVRP